LTLILASQSASRQAMLSAAGVPFTAQPALVDEDAAKASLGRERPRDLADALAELKALKVSARNPTALVLGSDSLAVLDDGSVLDKPASREEARDHLERMSGRRHDLVSAAVIVEGGRAVWRHVEAARMFVRPLS
jgi:septum formation protein